MHVGSISQKRVAQMDNPFILWERRQTPLTIRNFAPSGAPFWALLPTLSEAKDNYTVCVEQMPSSPGLFSLLNVAAFPLSGFVSGLIVLCSLIST